MSKKLFEFPDKEYGFLFNMYAGSITQEVGNYSGLNEYLRGMVYVSGVDENQKPVYKTSPKADKILLHYFYGAAVAYFDFKRIKKEISFSDVSEWIEELGIDECLKIYQESLQMPKNSEAPKETGQM